MKDGAHRVSFIHAPEVYYEQSHGARFIPLWAYTLAAYVPNEWSVSIFDCTVVNQAKIPEASVFAFSGINQDFYAIQTSHDYLKTKYPNSKFVLGGPITWSYNQDGKLHELEYFDHIFILDGEETFPKFLNQVAENRSGDIPKVIEATRFPIGNARKLRFDLLKPNANRYYGGVVEVSRGCPFLCEFCDIRVLPNNNEAHNKDVSLIVQELDTYYKLGIRQVQLACDNFIGDPVWTRRCVDAIVDWVQETGAEMALYTWITVNISRLPDLMLKMRKAGFTTLFIGVESFNTNSILETAKVQNQNDRNQLVHALKVIQSYGFIVVPGLIFGFDNDTPTMFEDMLNGILESGLIGGDPTFLLALPGTPLYARMKRTGRLVEHDQSGETIALHQERISKVESNIRYLQPKEFLIKSFMDFIKKFTNSRIMYARFRKHVSIIMESDCFVPVHSVGYGSLPEYLKFQCSSPANFKMFCKRIGRLLEPGNLIVIVKAYLLVLRHRFRYKGLKNHFTFWLFLWSNLIMKYHGLKEEDFKVHSIECDYDLGQIWRDTHHKDSALLPNGRNGDNVKVSDQAKATRKAMLRLKEVLGVSYTLSDFQNK